MNSVLTRFNRLRASFVALSLLLAILLSQTSPSIAQAQSASPRRVSPAALSAQIYQQYPDFPLENQYISSDTGAVDTGNTLVSRIIRYHIYIKQRPTNFRIDWKLTVADYLGAFEDISPERYVDYGLRENPMAGDIAVIEGLSPVERDRLVNALYEAASATLDSAS